MQVIIGTWLVYGSINIFTEKVMKFSHLLSIKQGILRLHNKYI